MRIVEDLQPATRYGNAPAQHGGDLPASAATPVEPETPIPVVLTRYAAQSLYAPLRTVEPIKEIERVHLPRDLALDTLLPTLPVRATALAAWRRDGRSGTALRLTNAAAPWIALDPRALQGDFVAATFQHPDLGPAGQSTDTTVLYLITRGHGLVDALLPAISPIDAASHLPAAAATEKTPGHGDHHEE